MKYSIKGMGRRNDSMTNKEHLSISTNTVHYQYAGDNKEILNVHVYLMKKFIYLKELENPTLETFDKQFRIGEYFKNKPFKNELINFTTYHMDRTEKHFNDNWKPYTFKMFK